jgi:hypothetical protein
VPSELVADYLAGALLALVHWWLDRGVAHTSEQMEAYFRRLVMPGVRTMLENGRS